MAVRPPGGGQGRDWNRPDQLHRGHAHCRGPLPRGAVAPWHDAALPHPPYPMTIKGKPTSLDIAHLAGVFAADGIACVKR